jgi:hypothetical protein
LALYLLFPTNTIRYPSDSVSQVKRSSKKMQSHD